MVHHLGGVELCMNDDGPWWRHWMSLVSVLILLSVSFRYVPIVLSWTLKWWEFG